VDEKLRADMVHADDLHPYINQFDVGAYRPVLRPIIDASSERGMSGDVGGVILRSWVMAGRVMLTFERGDTSVTILGAEGEDDPRFGLQSLDATVFEARAMIVEATGLYARWPDDYGRRFKDDPHTVLDVLAET